MTQSGTNDYGEAQYTAQIPADATGVVFSNGSGEQSQDGTIDPDAAGYYLGDSYEVTPWYSEGGNQGGNQGGETPTPTPSGETQTVNFTNNKGWTTVYIHYWDTDGNGTTWPGVAMTSAGTNGYGETLFTAEIPASATGVVFNNGNGSQSQDGVLDPGASGYYLGDSYEVMTWFA